MADDWVKIATVSSGFEADAFRATLEEAGIPVLVRGNQAGMFGSGFQGAVIGGMTILVPADAELRARELIDADFDAGIDDDEDDA